MVVEKFYYKVIETTTGKMLNPYFEKPSSLDDEENRDIRVPYSLLEKGVQLVRCYVRKWTDVLTLQDAIFKLGADNPLVESYEEVKVGHKVQEDTCLIAFLKLRIIVGAINEGWEPSGDAREWYAVYDGESCKSVLDVWVPRELAIQTADKAQFVCDNFSDLLVDYFCPVHIQTEK